MVDLVALLAMVESRHQLMGLSWGPPGIYKPDWLLPKDTRGRFGAETVAGQEMDQARETLVIGDVRTSEGEREGKEPNEVEMEEETDLQVQSPDERKRKTTRDGEDPGEARSGSSFKKRTKKMDEVGSGSGT